MKRLKKLFCILCTVCLLTLDTVPALANEITPTFNNLGRVIEDDYLKHNEPFSGDYVSFTVDSSKPYVRVAIQNTSTHGLIRLRLYEVVDGVENEIAHFTAEIGKWGETSVIYAERTEYHVRMDMYEGYLPEGLITIRTSAQNFQ